MDDEDKFLSSLSLDPEGIAKQFLNLSSGIHIVVAALMGFLVLLVYYRSLPAENRDKSLSLTIPVLSILMSVIMRIEGSQVILFFGIFGLLSIVRFRADLVDQRGIAFIIFALIEGVLIGLSAWILSLLAWLVVSGSIYVGKRLTQASHQYRLYAKSVQNPFELQGQIERVLESLGIKFKMVGMNHDNEFSTKTNAWEKKSRLEYILTDKQDSIATQLPPLSQELEQLNIEIEFKRMTS